MGKKLAIAVIHGMGSQGIDRPGASDTLSFSNEMANLVRSEFGALDFDNDIAWREIFWADILQGQQKDYLDEIKKYGRTRGDMLRKFVLCNLSDAASYRQMKSDANDTTYEQIHARVRETIEELDADTEDGAPLLVLAHSLGGHIMSNYIYDTTKPGVAAATPFQGLRQMAAFVTFGCNIPIFTFAYPRDKVWPIRFPGTDLPTKHKLRTWWYNFYDKDDVLGYPLEYVSPGYKQLVDDKGLRDHAVNSGNLFTSWNALSHNAYWKDTEIYKPVVKLMEHLVK